MVEKNLMHNVLQTSPLSLFNACSEQPLALFSFDTDKTLPNDSGLALVKDKDDEIIWHIGIDEDCKNYVCKDQGLKLIERTSNPTFSPHFIQGYSLHIQSPSIETTYIRCPPTKDIDLGITLPNLHLQVYLFDEHHPFMFEVSIKDHQGQSALLRWSTFKSTASLQYLNQQKPFLHMPLRRPVRDSTTLTDWCTIVVPLNVISKQITSVNLSTSPGNKNVPHSKPLFENFQSVRYIKIFGNCRLRRVWFTDQGNYNEIKSFNLSKSF